MDVRFTETSLVGICAHSTVSQVKRSVHRGSQRLTSSYTVRGADFCCSIGIIARIHTATH